MYIDKNDTLAAEKIAQIKDVVYQACGYDLDVTSSGALILNRQQKVNGCQRDYERYNTAYIEYLRQGKLSFAAQLKQITDTVDAN